MCDFTHENFEKVSGHENDEMEKGKQMSALKCSKCGGEMVEGTTPVFGDSFACTRRSQKKLQEQGVDRIRAYHCKSCGYIAFYKEIKKTKE